MIKTMVTCVVVLAALSGCASKAERIAEACRSYGIMMGTPAWEQCVMNERQAMAYESAASMAAGAALLKQPDQTKVEVNNNW